MSSLIRFQGNTDRGPSGKLWNSLVDWVRGTLAIEGGALDCDDFFPYDAGKLTLSTDGGSAATIQAVPFGSVNFAASVAADSVAGYTRNEYVDFTDCREVVREVRLDSVADATSPQTFVGFADTIPIDLFGTDGVIDGSALGLLWNADETVDLIAVSSSDVITVLYHEVATGVARTEGPYKFGVRVKKETATQYSIYGSVDGVVRTARVASTVVPQAAMFPITAQYIDGTTAPSFTADWDVVLDATPS